MKVQFFVLCCILQSIVGFNINDFIMYPPNLASSRIVGGEDAPKVLAPYQCSIQVSGSHFCGCSILSKKWILTASHCVEGQSTKNVEILVGTNDLRKGGTRYKTKKFIMHEKYNRPEFANDIAVIKLKEEIEFTDNVKPIKMYKDEVEDGAELLLTGWGSLEAGGRSPKKLQMIRLNAVQTERCKKIYGGRNVDDSHICTFTRKGEGSCNGDSGGPLVLGNKLVGVVNFGVSCDKGYPDGHAKISYLYDWVLEKTDL